MHPAPKVRKSETESVPRGRRVLVVADKAVDRIVLSRFAALAGVTTTEVGTAQAGGKLAVSAFDILLVDAGPNDDLHLPIIAGLTGEARPAVFVVASRAEIARAMNGDPQIDAAICKPVTTEKVVPAIRDILDGRAGL